MGTGTGWAPVLPHLILAAGSLVVFSVGAFARRRAGGLPYWLALVTAVAAGLVALGSTGSGTFAGLLDVGLYARFFTTLLSAIAVGSLLFLRRYADARGFAGDEFYGLLLLAALGMALTAGASHWLLFFLGLELFSLCLYVLIAAPKGDPAAREAGLKYFVMGAVASGFLTFGIALLYAATGTLEIAGSLTGGGAALAGLALVLVGIGFKISMVPFHLWTPDVYQGAPAPVTAFLSTGSKVALFAALLRLAAGASPAVWDRLAPVLWVLTALTLVVGNVTALRQTRVKRLLAYSSVAQMGYVLLGLVATRHDGVSAALFYLAAYAAMDLGAFGVVGSLSGEDGDRDDLEDFRGLGYTRPGRAAVLAVCLFSLAGLPPSAGFIGKFLLFRAVLETGSVGLAIVAALAAAAALYYYLKVVVALYMRPAEAEAHVPAAGPPAVVAGAAVVAVLLGVGVAPSVLLTLVSHAAAALAGTP